MDPLNPYLHLLDGVKQGRSYSADIRIKHFRLAQHGRIERSLWQVDLLETARMNVEQLPARLGDLVAAADRAFQCTGPGQVGQRPVDGICSERACSLSFC
jgi:hypothetical protein